MPITMTMEHFPAKIEAVVRSIAAIIAKQTNDTGAQVGALLQGTFGRAMSFDDACRLQQCFTHTIPFQNDPALQPWRQQALDALNNFPDTGNAQ
jgi:hypothetical protein